MFSIKELRKFASEAMEITKNSNWDGYQGLRVDWHRFKELCLPVLQQFMDEHPDDSDSAIPTLTPRVPFK